MIGRTVIYDDSVRTTVSGIVRDWDKILIWFTDFIRSAQLPKDFKKSNSYCRLEQPESAPGDGLCEIVQRNNRCSDINERFSTFIKKNVKLNSGMAKLNMQNYCNHLPYTFYYRVSSRRPTAMIFRKPYLPTLYAFNGTRIVYFVDCNCQFY